MNEEHERDEQLEAEVYRPPPGAPVWYQEDEDEVSLFGVLTFLLKHRWKLVGMAAAVSVILVGWTLSRPPTYTTDAMLMPQQPGSGGELSRLSGVAAQFGVDVPAGQGGQSPQFYADLLTSRRLLEEAVTSEYALSATRASDIGGPARPDSSVRESGEEDTVQASRSRSLVELYEIEARSTEIAVTRAARRLGDNITVSTNTETGVVTLAVTTSWAPISKQVADRLIDLVNRFNSRVRQSQAAEQVEFIGGRLDEARSELRSAEDSLEQFLQRNVQWQQSPELRFRHDRLQRRVNLKQQVYSSLASRYEEARISEVRSTPVVTTVTRPEIPAKPDSGRLLLKLVVGIIVGGIVGGLWAFGAEVVDGAREDSAEEYREFQTLKSQFYNEVKGASRKIRGMVSTGDGDDSR